MRMTFEVEVFGLYSILVCQNKSTFELTNPITHSFVMTNIANKFLTRVFVVVVDLYLVLRFLLVNHSR